MIPMIQSKDNQKYKLWMKLKTKKYRDQTGLFLVYGKTLVELAKSDLIVEEIVTSNETYEGTLIDEKLMKTLSVTETYYDIFAVCKKVTKPIESDKILILDDIQNPDNLGALLRSARAFGFRHVVISLDSADYYNDKTIRASAGSMFDLYLERRDIQTFIQEYRQKGYKAFGADAHNAQSKPLKNHPLMLVLGNEGHGLNPSTKAILDGFIRIETEGVESLNVAVAGSILMYEWSRL